MRLPPRTGLALAMLTAALLTVASPAHATTCAGLQSALDGTDPVVVLEGTCTGMTFTITRPVTLAGDRSDGLDGLNGALAGGRVLTVTDAGAVTVRDLILRDSAAGGDGGAVLVSGATVPTFERNLFFDNSAGGRGGALAITITGAGPVTLAGNSIGSGFDQNVSTGGGGGVYVSNGQAPVTLSDNEIVGNEAGGPGGGGVQIEMSGSAALSLHDNLFQLNKSTGGDGGGALLQLGSSSLALTDNDFLGNELAPNGGVHRGAGLAVLEGADIHQESNFIDRNVFEAGAATFAGGGGEAVLSGAPFFSRSDHWSNSIVPGPDGRGGGLYFEALQFPQTVRLENAVLAGNTLATNGKGGGLYLQGVPCPGGGDLTCAHLELMQATASGNQIGAGGSGAGIEGFGSLLVQNSIIKQNTGANDLATGGFNPILVSYSNVCAVFTTPFAGAGNICANPRLNAPGPGQGSVLETPFSPTLDRGSNDLVPPGLTTDFSGDPRLADSDANRTVVVDMGADEAPHAILPPPPPEGPGFTGTGGGDGSGVAGDRAGGGSGSTKASVKLLAPRVSSSKSLDNRFAVRFRPETGASVDHYELQVRQFPSKRYRKVSSNIRTKVYGFKGSYGRTYRFRGRAVTSAGAGSWARATTVVPLDDRGTRRIKRRGRWQGPRDRKAFGRSLSRASKKGAAISLRFRGKRVYIVARMSRRGGRMLVTLDRRRRQVNLRSSKTRNRRVVLTRKTSTRGSHLLRLQVIRGRVEIDAIGILDRR